MLVGIIAFQEPVTAPRLIFLALLPVGILLWLAVPQLPLLWDDRAYWRGSAVSLGLTAVILIFQLAVALLAAYGLARWQGRLRNAAYLLYCLLTLLPVQVMMLPNYLVCRSWGTASQSNIPTGRRARRTRIAFASAFMLPHPFPVRWSAETAVPL